MRLNKLSQLHQFPFAGRRTEMEVHTRLRRVEQPSQLLKTPIVVVGMLIHDLTSRCCPLVLIVL